jgi:hypothetical protein
MKLKNILNEGEGLSSNVVKKMVDTANKYIDKSNKDEILAVEPDGTWESVYEFEPIKLAGSYVTVIHKEVYGKKGTKKERFKWDKDDWSHIDELKYTLRWVVRSIKKGYKEEGQSAPSF